MSVDDATWSAIRRCYCGGEETISAIAAKFKVSRSTIQRRAKRDGWQRKTPTTAVSLSTSTKVRKRNVNVSPKHTASRKVQSGVVDRLYRAIDKKLKRLEARMESGEVLSPADSERETRELGSMVRSFEKLTEVAADINARQMPKHGRQARVSAGDAQRMREEITERLERLHSQRDAGGGLSSA